MTTHVALACGLLCLVIWLYLVVAHGRFWMVTAADNVAPRRVEDLIAVVIPARDEAHSIGEAVTSLLQQSCATHLHIFLVDDHSSDGTVALAREAAVRMGSEGRLSIIRGAALPSGWTGKLWAAQQGVEQALKLSPRFLLLTDADISHSPESVGAMVAIAEEGGYDLTSFMVKLNCRSFAERLLIPAFVYFFFLLYPPRWIRDARRRAAGAAGGCMLIRPEALGRVGGFATIRGEIIDDCALARVVKRSGGRVWLGAASETFSVRAYGSFSEIGQMIARTAFNQLGHSVWLLLGALLGLSLTFLLPLVLLFSGSRIVAAIAAMACLLMYASYVPITRFYGLAPTWAVALPIAAVFYTGSTALSAIRYWSGRGGEWKGRPQDAPSSQR